MDFRGVLFLVLAALAAILLLQGGVVGELLEFIDGIVNWADQDGALSI